MNFEKTAELPPQSQKTTKKPAGWGTLFLLQLVPVLAMGVAAWALVFIHERYQRAEGAQRASELAQYELKRLTASFNYRLNELREEMLHLYGEQANLARALNETERDRLIFFRREHLAAYAVLVPGTNTWEVQKYFLRENASKIGEQRDQAVRVFQDVMVAAKPFAVKRVEAAVFGAGWPDGDAYAVGFATTDENGQNFGIVGIFRPSYVFPFCKFFTDAFGLMPIGVFVLDERGRVVCHSQARLEGANFKEYQAYNALLQANSEARYSNAVGNSVTAAVKKVDPGPLLLVSEAAEVSPWATVAPYHDLTVAGCAILFVSIVCALIVARKVRSLAPARDGVDVPAATAEMPSTDLMGVELGEFTKLRRELKDLESTVLEMQQTHAFVAAFQKAAADLPAGEDLTKFLIDYLKPWGLAMSWSSEDIGREGVTAYPVHFGTERLGFLIIEGTPDSVRTEILPQILQIFAFTLRARKNA